MAIKGASLFGLVDHCEDQEVVEGVVVEGEKLLFAWFLAGNGEDVLGLYGEGGHDGVLEFLDQFFSLAALDLHRSSLLDRGELLLAVGEQVQPLVEGLDERVGVHAADNLELGVLFEDDGHDLDEVPDVGGVLLLLGVEVAGDEHVGVEEHEGGVLVPVEEGELVGREPVEEGLRGVVGVEAGALGEDEGVLVRADADEEVVLELLQVLDQHLVWLLHEHDVRVALLQPLLELLQLPLLVQERLSVVRVEVRQVRLHSQSARLVDVQHFVYPE